MMRADAIDLALMQRCRVLASRASRKGNHAVGSLLALESVILAEAEEEIPAGATAFAHAELLAVQRALAAGGRQHLAEATLYSTHEPCLLCSYAIRAARIGRVVLGQAVPEIGGVTSRYPILIARDISTWGPPPSLVWIEPPGEGERR